MGDNINKDAYMQRAAFRGLLTNAAVPVPDRLAIAAQLIDGLMIEIAAIEKAVGGKREGCTVLDRVEEWMAKAEADRNELYAYRQWLSDLDRCEHGRHIADNCYACRKDGVDNAGNKFLLPGQRVGTSVHEIPIIVPARDQFRNLKAWTGGNADD